MALEAICPLLLWRIDNFSTTTRCKSSAFRYLNSDWQWEYIADSDGLDEDSVKISEVFLTRLSPLGGGRKMKRFLSFVHIKTPGGRKTFEQMHTYEMEPRNRWLVFEMEKELIERKGLISKDCCIFSCSLEPLGTYEYLASLENESGRFTLSCVQDLSIDFGKLLSDTTLTDITLECRGLLIPAHRPILVLRSEKFATLLGSDEYNSSELLNVDDMEPEVLQTLIGYIYTGNVGLSKENVKEIYKASVEYGIHSLMKRSALFIMENINNFDACDVLLLAEEYKDNYLKAMVSSHIANDLTTLTSEGWKKFSESHNMLAIGVFQKFVERSYLRPELF